MTIAKTIRSMADHINEAYDTAATKGAGMPSQKNLANLPTTIAQLDKIEVVQETGTSTEAVMSQNATTEAVNSEAEARAAAITALDNKFQQDIQNYYTKAEVDQQVSAIPKFAIQVVDTLPTTDISDTTLYLVPSGTEGPDVYTEYIYVNTQWEELGVQTVDLSDYYTKTEADAAFVPKSDLILTPEKQTLLGNLVPGTSNSYVYSVTKVDTDQTDVLSRLRYSYRATDTGSTGSKYINLPMASSTQAGCVTAADKVKIDGALQTIDFNSGVAGVLPIANGGTGASTVDAAKITLGIPTKVSQLENDSGFVTSVGDVSLSTKTKELGSNLVVTSSSYNVLSMNPSSDSMAFGTYIFIGSVYVTISGAGNDNTYVHLRLRTSYNEIISQFMIYPPQGLTSCSVAGSLVSLYKLSNNSSTVYLEARPMNATTSQTFTVAGGNISGKAILKAIKVS